MKKILFSFLFFSILLPIVAQSSPKGYDEFLDNLKSVNIKMGKDEQQRIDKFMKRARKSICASSQQYRLRDYITKTYSKSSKKRSLKVLPIYGIFMDDKKDNRNKLDDSIDDVIINPEVDSSTLCALFLYNDSAAFCIEDKSDFFIFGLIRYDFRKLFFSKINQFQPERAFGIVSPFPSCISAEPLFLISNQKIVGLKANSGKYYSVKILPPYEIINQYLSLLKSYNM